MIFTACKRQYSSFKFNWIQARNELVVSIVALQDTMDNYHWFQTGALFRQSRGTEQ